MRTSELIKRVVEIKGIEDYRQDGEMLYFYASKQSGIVAYVNRINKFGVSTSCANFKKLPSFSQELLLDLLYEYAITPLEEREEPNKYKLKHKLISRDGYLNYLENKKEFIFSIETEIEGVKTVFTAQEWESLTGQIWEDLLLQFEAIGV